MKKIIYSLLIALGSINVFAQEYQKNPYCYIQSNNQYQCENTPGCAWIQGNQMGSCLGRPGLPNSQTQFCYVNNNNPQNCMNTPFCYYQNSSQPSSCVSR